MKKLLCCILALCLMISGTAFAASWTWSTLPPSGWTWGSGSSSGSTGGSWTWGSGTATASPWVPSTPAGGEIDVVQTTSTYSCSSAQLNNIALAAAAIDGYCVRSGDIFSFNNIVGERSQARGYENAVNGRGVVVRGGGVAQVATTLYLALLQMDDISFTSLRFYGDDFTGNYVSSGNMAVVTDYSAGTDFSFQNLGADLYIYMDVDASCITCTISSEEADDAEYVYSASFYVGSGSSLRNNISIASGYVDGTVLAPGDVFSFNDTVGPRSEARGYDDAINGRGADVLGGGVAQVASAIYLATKQIEGVSYLEKETYGRKYNQSYVSSADDAILTDYRAGTDFKFQNNTGYTMEISIYLYDGNLYCDVTLR